MEPIEFKRKGFLYLFHKILFNKDPKDTCEYKREIIFTAIICSLSLHAFILRCIFMLFREFRINPKDYTYKFYGLCMVIVLFSMMAGINIIEDELFFNDFINWHKLSFIQLYFYSIIPLLIGLIVIALFLSITFSLVWVCWFIYDEWISRISIPPIHIFEQSEEPKTQLGVMYKSFKERWCKKIIWKNQQNKL